MKYVLGALIFLVACAPAVDRAHMNDSAIIAGQEVPAKSDLLHSTVGIVLPRANDACTGVLIAENLVLTAAHCAEEIRGAYVHTGSGEYEESRVREVIDVRISEEWDQSNEKNWNDIAIFRVAGPTLQGTKIATLADLPSLYRKNQVITLIGYGIINMKTEETSLNPHFAVSLMSDPNFAPNEFSALPYKGRGTCHGDSGGPVYGRIDNKLVVLGLTSRSITPSGAFNCAEGSVYTRVDKFKSWILKAASELGTNPALIKFSSKL